MACKCALSEWEWRWLRTGIWCRSRVYDHRDLVALAVGTENDGGTGCFQTPRWGLNIVAEGCAGLHYLEHVRDADGKQHQDDKQHQTNGNAASRQTCERRKSIVQADRRGRLQKGREKRMTHRPNIIRAVLISSKPLSSYHDGPRDDQSRSVPPDQ